MQNKKIASHDTQYSTQLYLLHTLAMKCLSLNVNCVKQGCIGVSVVFALMSALCGHVATSWGLVVDSWGTCSSEVSKLVLTLTFPGLRISVSQKWDVAMSLGLVDWWGWAAVVMLQVQNQPDSHVRHTDCRVLSLLNSN